MAQPKSMRLVTEEALESGVGDAVNTAISPGGSARAILEAAIGTGGGSVSSAAPASFAGVDELRDVKWVSIFGTGDNWTISGAGSLSDTSDYVLGDRSARMNVPESGSGYVQSVGRTPIDATDNILVMAIKVDKPENIGNVTIRASSLDNGATASNLFWNANGSQGLPYIAGEWQLVTLTQGEVSTDSGVDLTQIRSYRIGVNANGSGPVIAHVGGIGWVAPSRPRPAVVLTFDDTRVTAYTVAKAAMDRHRLRGVQYPILDRIDAPGYLTSKQIDNMVRYSGWEIGMHSTTETTHATPMTMSRAERLTEYSQMISWNAQRGYPAESFALPLGSYNSGLLDDARRHFVTTRLAYNQMIETAPFADRGIIRATGVGQKDAAWLKSYADKIAASPGGLGVYLFHDLPESVGGDNNAVAAADFVQFIDYLAALRDAGHVDVITMAEAARRPIVSTVVAPGPMPEPDPMITSDSFDGPDNTSTWNRETDVAFGGVPLIYDGGSSSWGTTGGKLVVLTQKATYMEVIRPNPAAPVTLSIKIDGDTEVFYAVLKATSLASTDTRLRLTFATKGFVRLDSVQGGVENNGSNHPYSPGDTITARDMGDGSATLLINGTEIVTRTGLGTFEGCNVSGFLKAPVGASCSVDWWKLEETT